MGKLVKKNGKLLKKDGKLVRTDDVSKCPCCGGDGPCPPDKHCTWQPPDPCSTGKCQPSSVSDTPPIQSQCGDAPYDCTSEEACNQWYAQHPNPLCPCWVCEDGKLVDRPAYTADCKGWPGPKPEGVDCPPPPAKYICAIRSQCSQYPLTHGRWFWLRDGRWAVGDDRCQREPPFTTCTIADPPNRPGAFESEIVNVGCKEATPSTTKQCITEEEFAKGGWIKVSGPHDTLQLCEAACNPPPPGLWCCDGGAEGYFCGERVNVPGIGEMIGDAPIGICNSVKKVDDCSKCGLPPPNPCTGYGEYLWTGKAWEIDDITCRPALDCRPAPPPTQPGDFVGELRRVDCQPRVNSANNPLP